MAEKAKSVSHDRQVRGYLRPMTFNKFEDFLTEKGLGKSEAINQIIEDYFARQGQQKPQGKNNY